MAIDVDKISETLDARAGKSSQVAAFKRYEHDPVGFALDVLGVTLWSHQRRALEAIAASRRVAWRSSHGVGKTQALVCAVAWFVATQPDALVICTAPSYRQVRSVLWRTLCRIIARARLPIGGELSDVPEHGWKFPDGRLVVGFSAGDAEKLAGFHAPNVLAVVDEASGMAGEILEALKGALTGRARLILAGNPTKVGDEFQAAFGAKAHLYTTLHTSAADVPNVSGLEPAIEGLIDQAWVDEMIADYGEGSAAVAIRVHGNFAEQNADAVIGLGLVEASVERYRTVMAEAGAFDRAGELRIGVDVARFGDDSSAIVLRRGFIALAPVIFQGLDVVQLAGKVLQLARDYRRDTEIPTILVDTIGVGGGVADVLKQHEDVSVVEVNVSERPTSDKYAKLRDELFFQLRDWLKDGGAIAPDPKLEAELTTPTYGFTANQLIKVEGKDETRKKLKRSPDRADALALACHSARAIECSSAYSSPFAQRDESEEDINAAIMRRHFNNALARHFATGPTDPHAEE